LVTFGQRKLLDFFCQKIHICAILVKIGHQKNGKKMAKLQSFLCQNLLQNFNFLYPHLKKKQDKDNQKKFNPQQPSI
jgi:hypothetical protein